LKLRISYILIKNKEENMALLQNAILRANNITSKSYFLLRLWVLDKYHSNQEIPEITEDAISTQKPI
jgi:hypothetical protein